MNYSVNKIIQVLNAKKYKVFAGSALNLNIVGIRSDITRAGSFDDELVIFYETTPGQHVELRMPFTADPGVPYLKTPINPAGTAIVKPGQYRGAYKLGDYKGRPALLQVKPITVYRTNKQDGCLDTHNLREETGLFGCHIHIGSTSGSLEHVGKCSAGCQVPQDPWAHNLFMILCDMSAGKYGPYFTYTLLHQRDFEEHR